MYRKESTDISRADTAPDDMIIKMDHVSKSFTQWHRREGIRNLLRQEEQHNTGQEKHQKNNRKIDGCQFCIIFGEILTKKVF